jgi:hypothetical protein
MVSKYLSSLPMRRTEVHHHPFNNLHYSYSPICNIPVNGLQENNRWLKNQELDDGATL